MHIIQFLPLHYVDLFIEHKFGYSNNVKQICLQFLTPRYVQDEMCEGLESPSKRSNVSQSVATETIHWVLHLNETNTYLFYPSIHYILFYYDGEDYYLVDLKFQLLLIKKTQIT